jgi:hypothetical protein
MTQQEKDLLIKDLCSRLPYGVKCEDGYGNVLELNGINNPNTVTFKCSDKTFWSTNLDECKPYLFPLSSMTEEQKSYLYFNTNFEVDMFGKLVVKMDADDNYLYTDLSDYTSIINWLIENKFDYQGLIPMGLAIDATGLNIYSNKNNTYYDNRTKKIRII